MTMRVRTVAATAMLVAGIYLLGQWRAWVGASGGFAPGASAYGGAILVLAGAALWSASSKWNLTHRLGMGVSIVLMAPIIALWAPILRSGVQGTYAGEGHIPRCGVVEVEPGPAPVTRLLWCATPVDGAPLALGRRYGMWYAFDPYRGEGVMVRPSLRGDGFEAVWLASQDTWRYRRVEPGSAESTKRQAVERDWRSLRWACWFPSGRRLLLDPVAGLGAYDTGSREPLGAQSRLPLKLVHVEHEWHRATAEPRHVVSIELADPVRGDGLAFSLVRVEKEAYLYFASGPLGIDGQPQGEGGCVAAPPYRRNFVSVRGVP